MKRTPLNRGTTPLRRHTPLRQQSARRRGETQARRWALDEVRYRDGDRCSACDVLEHECRPPLDGHEILPRSAGGSHLDPANIRLICRAAHTYVHDNPAEAYGLGLLRHAWEPPYPAA